VDRSSIDLWAEITAMGPFRPELADQLEYSGSYYKNTRTGAPVLRELFAMEGNDSSIKLATLLGISDVWDFDRRKI